MELKRRIALSTMILAIGLGSGHLVQSRSAMRQQGLVQTAAASGTPKPVEIVQLAAEVEEHAVVAPAALVPALPPQALAPELPAEDLAPPPGAAGVVAEKQIVDVCGAKVDLVPQPAAMIGIALSAPCHMSERVVVRHGGLAVTAKTSSVGSLFMTVPAMEILADVSVLFLNGDVAEAQIQIPDVLQYRRFAVQWLGDDAFQVHAFENGADYGAPGHVSAADPKQAAQGAQSKGGFLTLLGDDQVTLPMLAEVYTYPSDAAASVEIVVEAAVTEKTCERELLGETLTSVGGMAYVTELTTAMPDCDAVGDILVLKNLVPDMKIAAAN